MWAAATDSHVCACKCVLPRRWLPSRPACPHIWHSLALYGRLASAGCPEELFSPVFQVSHTPPPPPAQPLPPALRLRWNTSSTNKKNRLIADIHAHYFKRASFMRLRTTFPRWESLISWQYGTVFMQPRRFTWRDTDNECGTAVQYESDAMAFPVWLTTKVWLMEEHTVVKMEGLLSGRLTRSTFIQF